MDNNSVRSYPFINRWINWYHRKHFANQNVYKDRSETEFSSANDRFGHL